MKKIASGLFLLLLVFAGIGCDSSSSDDETSIADLLDGDWMLTSISDDGGDKTEVFTSGFDGLDVTFTQSGDFSLDVDSKVDEDDVVINGTWTVNESQNKLTLTTSVSGIPVGLEFTYSFSGNDVISLTASSATSILLNQLLQTTLQGSVSFTIQRS